MDRETLEKSVIQLESSVKTREKADRASVEVSLENLLNLMEKLKDDGNFAFDMLLDHTAIDKIEQGKFELIYNLYSTIHGHYLMVTCSIDRNNPVVSTVSQIWQVAHWQEREVFDLFGILYDGHPDLRRVFLEDDWQGFPLRKDYKDSGMLEFEK